MGGGEEQLPKQAAELQKRRQQRDLLAKIENLNYSVFHVPAPVEAGSLARACPSHHSDPRLHVVLCAMKSFVMWPKAPGMPLLPHAGEDLCMSPG